MRMLYTTDSLSVVPEPVQHRLEFVRTATSQVTLDLQNQNHWEWAYQSDSPNKPSGGF